LAGSISFQLRLIRGYELSLKTRMDPTASILRGITERARVAQARMIFAEGDDPRVLRAAVMYQRSGFGKALVVGRQHDVAAKLDAAGMGDAVQELDVVNAANTEHLDAYKSFLFERLQRKGFDNADIHRLATRDRHVFSALMLAHGHGDGLVTGVTRKSAHVMGLLNHVFDADAEHGAAGVTALLHKGRIVLIADTLVHEWPEAEDLANIAERAADVARDFGLEPRVAFVSFSTFGYPVSERAEKLALAPKVLDAGQHLGGASTPFGKHIGETDAGNGWRHGDRTNSYGRGSIHTNMRVGFHSNRYSEHGCFGSLQSRRGGIAPWMTHKPRIRPKRMRAMITF